MKIYKCQDCMAFTDLPVHTCIPWLKELVNKYKKKNANNQQFKKGESVYIAEASYTDTFIACPDCLGTLKWTIVFADGDVVEVSCQTCKIGYTPANGRIQVQEWKPQVSKRTVGSVRFNDTDKNPFSYMCEETGVGSGRVYYEVDMFDNPEDAEKRAKEIYEEIMRSLAQNNFSKKFGGTKELERELSTWGFSRSQVVEKARLFRKWAKISGIIKD